MKIRTLLTAAMITAVGFGATQLWAFDGERVPPMHQMGGGEGPFRHGPEGFIHELHQLNLTEQQKNELKALHENNAPAAKASHEKMRQLHEQMHDLLNADNIDEAAVKSLSAQVAELQADQMILHAKLKKQALALLTDEQRAKMKKMRQERFERMKRSLDDE